MVGSGLLGGSNYVPVTKEEREKFIAGVEIRAKYVGAIEVPEPRGETTHHTCTSDVQCE